MSGPADMSDGPRLRLEFWREFAAFMSASPVRCCRASMDTWMTHGGDINFGSLFTICRIQIGEIGAQFALESVGAKSIFAFLASRAASIDRAFESEPLWRAPANSQTALIEVRNGADVRRRDQWPNQFAWLRRELETFQTSLWPLLGRVPPKREPRIWDERSFTEELSRYNPWSVGVVGKVLDWSVAAMPDRRWGRGQRRGAFYVGFHREGHDYYPFGLAVDGTFAINLPALAGEIPFDSESARLEVLQRLNHMPGLSLPPDALAKRVRLPIAMLDGDAALHSLFAWMEWLRECVVSTRVVP